MLHTTKLAVYCCQQIITSCRQHCRRGMSHHFAKSHSLHQVVSKHYMMEIKLFRTFKDYAPLQHSVDVGSSNNSSEVFDTGIQSLPPVVESFSNYGLGGHMYPHHWLQNGLEFIHNLDIGWMPTIAIITVALRIIAIPTYVKMRQFNARSQNHLPEQLELQYEIMRANNPIEKQKKRLALMEFMKEKRLNPLKPLLYSLPISGIFISFFAALRGICEVKLPSFVHGGALWFPDLTMPDPYYILPMLSCLSLHLLIRCGAATAEVGPAENIPALKTVLLWCPLLFFPFAVFQPSCMFVFWTASNCFSMILLLVFSLQKARIFCNIPDQIPHPPSTKEYLKKMSMSNLIKESKKQAALRNKALKKVNNHMDKMKERNKIGK